MNDQLRSIDVDKSNHDFRILVRDNGSTDDTLHILNNWAASVLNFDIVAVGEESLGP
ncbi:MAG: hypothetical protein ABFS32_14055 [Bacteroidota bacterium]